MRSTIGFLASAALAAALLGAGTNASEAAGRGFGPGGLGKGPAGGPRGGYSHAGIGGGHGWNRGDHRRFGRDRHPEFGRYGRGFGRYGFGYGAGYGFGFGGYGLYDPLGDHGRFGGRDVIADAPLLPPPGPPAVLGIRDAAVLPPAIYVIGGKSRRSSGNGGASRKRAEGGPAVQPARIIAVR